MSNPGFMRACAYGWGGLASIIFVSGVLLALLDPTNLTRQLTAPSMVLNDNSLGMTLWKTPPTPVLFKVYFWNVTNPQMVINGAKPKLAEVGPYVYVKYLQRTVAALEENDTLVYRESDQWAFSGPHTGQLQESDVITILHLPILGMILRVHEIAPEYVGYLEGVWSSLFPTADDLFMTGTVKDILFDGIPVDCHSKDFMVTTACNNLEDDPPNTIRKVGNKEFRFSFFDYKRHTSNYTITVNRGLTDFSKIKQIVSFNNAATLNKWRNVYCDMLNGSDGSQFPPNLKPTDVIYMFEPDLCRSMYARYEKEISFEGLQLFRFVNTPDLFASVEENPDNECFCVPKAQLSDFMGGGGGDDDDEEPPPKTCLKSGAMLLTPCLGAPVTVTFPHFYMADKSFSDYVDLSPSKELHETFVDVEPLTGVPVRGSKRIQFNVEVKPIEEMPLMVNLTPGFFPILWVEESFVATEDILTVFRQVQWVNRNVNTVGCIFAAVAGVFIVVIAFCYKKAANSGTWDTDSTQDEPRGYNGHAPHGLYTNRAKAPVNGKENGNGQVKPTGLMPDYPVLMRRNGGRVYPNAQHTISGLYAENFM